MATIYEVAERAGVSLSTVSRVINGRKSVNQVMREKVERAMAELDYRPNSMARSLASNRTDSIGLLVSELNTPFFGEMMKAVESTLRAANKHVIITVGNHELAQEKDGVDFLFSRNCDALIMHVEALTDSALRHINEQQLPVALVNRVVEGMESACMVLDNEQGGYLATRHLIDLGHRNIAYITGPVDKADAQERLAGHQRALKEAGVSPDPALVYQGDYTEEAGKAGFNHLLATNRPFTALVCANDWAASGAIGAARDAGVTMPGELSIVGFDDVHFAHHILPRLTTVRNPIFEMGEMAARHILREVYKKPESVQNRFTPELIVRDSTCPPNST